MSNIQVNDSALRNLLNSLDSDSNRAVINKALRKGANKLLTDTKTILRAKLGRGATTPNRWNGKTMESGVRLKADRDYMEVSVSIMGDFRLKFFEKGTQLRNTKRNNANRGRIKGLNFFSDARDREEEIISTINNSIRNSLNNL